MKKQNILNISTAGIIAAIYTVLCILLRPISFSGIQLRFAEALCILPYFTPAAIPGLTIGCLLGNILGGADIFDIAFGTVATFIGAGGTFLLRHNRYLAPLPPIISNTVILPLIFRYAYGYSIPLWILFLTVGAGEILACGVLGLGLLFLLEKYRKYLF